MTITVNRTVYWPPVLSLVTSLVIALATPSANGLSFIDETIDQDVTYSESATWEGTTTFVDGSILTVTGSSSRPLYRFGIVSPDALVGDGSIRVETGDGTRFNEINQIYFGPGTTLGTGVNLEISGSSPLNLIFPAGFNQDGAVRFVDPDLQTWLISLDDNEGQFWSSNNEVVLEDGRLRFSGGMLLSPNGFRENFVNAGGTAVISMPYDTRNGQAFDMEGQEISDLGRVELDGSFVNGRIDTGDETWRPRTENPERPERNGTVFADMQIAGKYDASASTVAIDGGIELDAGTEIIANRIHFSKNRSNGQTLANEGVYTTLSGPGTLKLREFTNFLGQRVDPVFGRQTHSASEPRLVRIGPEMTIVVEPGTTRLLAGNFENYGTILIPTGSEASIGGRSWENRGTILAAGANLFLAGQYTASDLNGIDATGGSVQLGPGLDLEGETYFAGPQLPLVIHAPSGDGIFNGTLASEQEITVNSAILTDATVDANVNLSSKLTLRGNSGFGSNRVLRFTGRSGFNFDHGTLAFESPNSELTNVTIRMDPESNVPLHVGANNLRLGPGSRIEQTYNDVDLFVSDQLIIEGAIAIDQPGSRVGLRGQIIHRGSIEVVQGAVLDVFGSVVNEGGTANIQSGGRLRTFDDASFAQSVNAVAGSIFTPVGSLDARQLAPGLLPSGFSQLYWGPDDHAEFEIGSGPLILEYARQYLLAGGRLSAESIDARVQPLHIGPSDDLTCRLTLNSLTGQLIALNGAEADLDIDHWNHVDLLAEGTASLRLAQPSFGFAPPVRMTDSRIAAPLQVNGKIEAIDGLVIDGSLDWESPSFPSFGSTSGLSLVGFSRLEGSGEVTTPTSFLPATFTGGRFALVSDTNQIEISEELTLNVRTHLAAEGEVLINHGTLRAVPSREWLVESVDNHGVLFIDNEATEFSEPLVIEGSLKQETGGSLAIVRSAGGPEPGTSWIQATEEVSLAGTLDLSQFSSEPLSSGDTVTVITSLTGLVGGFDQVIHSSAASNAEFVWAVTIEQKSVMLTAARKGDANLNGQIEQGDLNAVLSNWGQNNLTDPSADISWVSGDFDGDGLVAQSDLNAVLNNWGSSVAPDFTGFTVPEPATLGLVGIGLASVSLRRRCA
ncbi:MAG: PEP-CTERM sorting domain-containing protein [Planctomycetota bacterium]